MFPFFWGGNVPNDNDEKMVRMKKKCIPKVEESGSKTQWAEYLSYLDSMVEDGLLR